METTLISKCHSVEVAERYDESGLFHTCSKCYMVCEVEEVCAFCLGDGEVSTDETDSDGNVEQGVGTQKCVCRIDEEEYDEDERY